MTLRCIKSITPFLDHTSSEHFSIITLATSFKFSWWWGVTNRLSRLASVRFILWLRVGASPPERIKIDVRENERPLASLRAYLRQTKEWEGLRGYSAEGALWAVRREREYRNRRTLPLAQEGVFSSAWWATVFVRRIRKLALLFESCKIWLRSRWQ